MKSYIISILVLTVVMSTIPVSDAEAGVFDKWRNKDKQEESPVPPRYDLFPTMSFHVGQLGRGVGSGWTLAENNLVISADCEVSSSVSSVQGLSEGRSALVMGSKVGDTIIAYRVRIMQPDFEVTDLSDGMQFFPSDVDPTVGEGSGPE